MTYYHLLISIIEDDIGPLQSHNHMVLDFEHPSENKKNNEENPVNRSINYNTALFLPISLELWDYFLAESHVVM
tara:strand:+ start:2262 stop:2483 length:222 start_codon:yes stop_codon:yes gene_type:complete